MKATANLFLDTRRPKANGKYPVKIRVYIDTKTKLYPAEEDLSKSDFFDAYQSKKPRKECRELKLKLQELESKAAKVAAAIDPFSFEKFEKRMFRSAGDANNIIYYYRQYILKLTAAERHGTAESYSNSLKSIQNFLREKNNTQSDYLSFDSVTTDFLAQYEKWMQKKEKSLTTVGIYLRPLRCIFNLAIEEGDIPLSVYPFGKRKYQIPAGRNTKKSLDKGALKALFSHELHEDSFQSKARDFWFLSYACNGMNIRDIVELKYKDIQGDRIVFRRSKTKNTTKTDLKPLTVPITDYVKEIIKRHGNPIKKDSYIFPILSEGITELEKLRRTMNFTKFINQHIKKLAEAAGITTDISTYWARHSFTTSAIRDGASLEFIQESLGHQDMKTTMNYWGGFEDKVKRGISEKLMDFA